MTAGSTRLVHSGDRVNNTSPNGGNERTNTSVVFSEDNGIWDESVKQHVEEEAKEPFPQDSAHHPQNNKMRESRGFAFRRNDTPNCPESDSPTALAEEYISLPQTPLSRPLPVPTSPLGDIVPLSSTQSYSPSQITNTPASNTHGPAQAAAKTSRTSCTPSPTESLPPSAST